MSKKGPSREDTDSGSDLNCAPETKGRPPFIEKLPAQSSHFGPFHANEVSNLCTSDWSGQVAVYWLDGSMATEGGTSLQ